jgi:hypothetical protein
VNTLDEQDVAWALVEEARMCLTIPELNSVFVTLGTADVGRPAIETMVRAVASSKAPLSSVLVAGLGRWIDTCAGTSAEPRLRRYLSLIDVIDLPPQTR